MRAKSSSQRCPDIGLLPATLASLSTTRLPSPRPQRINTRAHFFSKICIVPYNAALPWHVQTSSHWAYISQLIPHLPFFDRNSAFVTPLPS